MRLLLTHRRVALRSAKSSTLLRLCCVMAALLQLVSRAFSLLRSLSLSLHLSHTLSFSPSHTHSFHPWPDTLRMVERAGLAASAQLLPSPVVHTSHSSVEQPQAASQMSSQASAVSDKELPPHHTAPGAAAPAAHGQEHSKTSADGGGAGMSGDATDSGAAQDGKTSEKAAGTAGESSGDGGGAGTAADKSSEKTAGTAGESSTAAVAVAIGTLSPTPSPEAPRPAEVQENKEEDAEMSVEDEQIEVQTSRTSADAAELADDEPTPPSPAMLSEDAEPLRCSKSPPPTAQPSAPASPVKLDLMGKNSLLGEPEPSAGEQRVHRAVFAAAMNVLWKSEVIFRLGTEQELSVADYLRSRLLSRDSCPARRRFLVWAVQFAWVICRDEAGVASKSPAHLTSREKQAAKQALHAAQTTLREEASIELTKGALDNLNAARAKGSLGPAKSYRAAAASEPNTASKPPATSKSKSASAHSTPKAAASGLLGKVASDLPAASPAAAASTDVPAASVARSAEQQPKTETPPSAAAPKHAHSASATPAASSNETDTVSAAQSAPSSQSAGAAAARGASAALAERPPPAFAAHVVKQMSPTKQRMRELLAWLIEYSDHVIRDGSPSFQSEFPGSLVTSYRPEQYKFKMPPLYLWLYDEALQLERRANPHLAEYQKTPLLLPYLTCGVAGYGDCLLEAALLADCRDVRFEQKEKAKQRGAAAANVQAAVLNAPRDPVFANVMDSGREEVAKALKIYRDLSANNMSCSCWPLVD